MFKLTSPSLLLLALFCASRVSASEIAVSEWLVLGPLPLAEPAFADSVPTIEQKLEEFDLDLEDRWIREGDPVVWAPSQETRWRRVAGESITLERGSSEIAYAAVYLTADRWQKVTVTAKSSRPVSLLSESGSLGSATSRSGEDSLFTLSEEYTAHTGKHLLVLKGVNDPESEGAWTISVAAEIDSTAEGSVHWSIDPRHGPAHYGDYADVIGISHVQVSPNGKRVAALLTERDGEGKRRAWIEIYETVSGRLVRTIRMTKSVANPRFLPKDGQLAFTTSSEDGVSIWICDLETREIFTVLEDVKGLDGFHFSPDERLLYYSASEEPDDEGANYTLYRELTDRAGSFDKHRTLYVHAIEGDMTRPLTCTGEFALQDWRLSPDGRKLLIIRDVTKATRPYSRYEFWVRDLESGSQELVTTHDNIEAPGSIVWLPGNRIAYAIGSHDADPSDTVYHNASNVVLRVLDVARKETRKLTEGALYSIADARGHQRVFWNPADRKIWFHALRGGERVILKISPEGGEASEAVRTDFPFIDVPGLAVDGSVVAYVASDVSNPPVLYARRASGGKPRLISDPNASLREDWIFGNMSDWDFKNSGGWTIDGWLYHPADFTPDRQWPLIVYFYGGVSPRDLRFTFTYQWWLANGYCVYVLNPVGSVGYGQEFADLHANDWGSLATQDVIEGARKLLAEKPYLDPERVGAYGGSYGGFVVLDLVTKTDIFAAAVDMYGISNIASYFGGGTWGYWYNDISAPGSFPWNRRDVYVDKSPVFNADKITTPLLILHGASDVNVPPLESDQMFVALKLLGRDVAYAKFSGESHNINRKFENLVEHREMMLEWFDKYLKDRPEAWEHRLETQE